MDLKYVLCAFLLTFTQAKAQISVDFIMSARDLPNMDIFDGAPDPYLKVFYSEGSNDFWGLVGETERLANTNNPDFNDIFNVNYNPLLIQRIKFEVWDEDVDQLNDEMGYVEFNLGSLANSTSTLNLPIQDCTKDFCGTILVTRRLNKEITPNLDPRFINPSNIINIRTKLKAKTTTQ